MKKFLVLLAVAWSPVRAEFYTGNELLQRLQSDSNIEKAVALGFVGGVADAWDRILFCPPDGSTVGQARDIALRHLVINPAKRHQAAAGLVADALMEAWPCQQQKKGGRL